MEAPGTPIIMAKQEHRDRSVLVAMGLSIRIPGQGVVEEDITVEMEVALDMAVLEHLDRVTVALRESNSTSWKRATTGMAGCRSASLVPPVSTALMCSQTSSNARLNITVPQGLPPPYLASKASTAQGRPAPQVLGPVPALLALLGTSAPAE